MPGIFISYRREDTAGHAGRLFDRLREHFGKDRVFMDVAGIEPGVDFAEAIEKAVGSCAVLLVVIGREWSSCTDQSGRRRLDDPNDFVRLEIASALKRTVRVIPVLVEGAVIPAQEVLPDDVKLLARRNAVELRDTRWDADVQDLTTQLEKILTPAPPPVEPSPRSPEPSVPAPGHAEPTTPRREPRRPLKPTWLIGCGIVALVLAGLAGLALFSLTLRTPAPKEIVVPDVLDKPLDEARHAIERAGLKMGEIAREPVPGTSPGTVVRQKPPGGTRLSPGPGAEQEGVVTLAVAEKSPPAPDSRVEVPHVVGMGLDLALERIKSAGLGVGSREGKPSRDIPPNQVLSQTPKPGILVDRGTPVNLVFALKAAVTVPDVYRRPLAEALAILEKAGLTRGRIQEVPSGSTSAGYVVRQEPKAGEEAAAGTDVDLWVTARPEPVTVPDVRRLSLKEAELALAKQKLRLGRVTYRETRAAPDTVLDQRPAAGEPVNQGTPVDLLMARRAEPGLPEDCLAFNPGTATVRKIGDRWKIMDGRQVLFDFGADDAEARRSLDIIKHYRMNQSCFVGRPDPSFTYLLVSGRAPSGNLSGDDCISFNPNNLQMSEIGGRWKIVEGNHWLFDFGGNRAEAEQALGIIKKYGFTNSCYVGRPGPSFAYLRR